VISSQGAPVLAKSEVPAALPWDQPRMKRDTPPLRNRSPVQTFRSTPSLSPLGNALACSGAALAQQDDAQPGRGLYVAMQRGLGPREPPKQARDRRHDPSPTRPATPLQQRRNVARPSVSASFPAASYEAVPEDTLDMYMQKLARCLPQNGARSLLIRRLSRGEYEVDGCRVSIALRGGEAYVYATNSNNDADRAEALQSYLLRAADNALARSMNCGGPSGASFNQHEVMPRVPLGVRSQTVHMPSSGNPYAGVLVRAPDGGSFLLGSSFYSQTSVSESKPPHMEALHLMQTQPTAQTQSLSQLQRSHALHGSFFLSHDQLERAHGVNLRSHAASSAPLNAGYPFPAAQVPGTFYGHPAFVAVSG